METLQAIYIALAIFGVGVTIVDLFGALDHGGSGGHDSDHGSGHDSSHDSGHDGGHDLAHGHDDGSVLALPRARDGASRVATLVSALRLGVYFSLGAGPTGLVALALHLGGLASSLWALGAGLAIAALARGLRSFIRKDLDSSFRAEDFILEEAEVTVPVAPGLMGKAEVKKFGTNAEVYIKATRGDAAYARGAKVRIIDYQDDCYLVEAADEEHLVH